MPYFGALHEALRELAYIAGNTTVLEDCFPNEQPELFVVVVAAELLAFWLQLLPRLPWSPRRYNDNGHSNREASDEDVGYDVGYADK